MRCATDAMMIDGGAVVSDVRGIENSREIPRYRFTAVVSRPTSLCADHFRKISRDEVRRFSRSAKHDLQTVFALPVPSRRSFPPKTSSGTQAALFRRFYLRNIFIFQRWKWSAREPAPCPLYRRTRSLSVSVLGYLYAIAQLAAYRFVGDASTVDEQFS